MKKMDEMDRNIRLRSEELGYKIAVLVLAIWTLYESWQTLFNDSKAINFPMYILALVLCVQGFSEMAMKRKMIAGDEEYSEPNKLVWSVIAIIAIIAIVIALGLSLYKIFLH